VGAGNENRIKNRVRYSFNLNAELGKQLITYRMGGPKSTDKVRREGVPYWVVIDMWWLEPSPRKRRYLATSFNIENSELADSFLMEIEENVNPGTEKSQCSKMLFGNRKNMQSQIVVGYSGYRMSAVSIISSSYTTGTFITFQS
jgi:hypothetical protein